MLTPPCVAAVKSYTSATKYLGPREDSASKRPQQRVPATSRPLALPHMVDKPQPSDGLATPSPDSAPPPATSVPARRGPGHRGADMRDTVAEMAERAQIISQEAGTKVAAAMRDVISAGAGIAGFAIESARDLVNYMVRRGQMTPEEADKLIREAEAAHEKRPASEKVRPTASKIAAERAAVAKAEAAARAAAQAAAMPPFRPTPRPTIAAPVAPEPEKAKPLAKGAAKPAAKTVTSAKTPKPPKPEAKPAKVAAKPTKAAKSAKVAKQGKPAKPAKKGGKR
jgi:polyhydroxyalkanoate synthesis regulator phasin